MNYKLSLIFVAMIAISYVHSLPKLSDFNGISARDQSQVVEYIQKLKDLRSADKSDSSEEEIEWKDLFFTVFFDEDSDEQDNITTFSPEFDPSQFAARLNVDIKKAYQRRCKKISGSDETHDKVKAAYKDFGKCLKTTVDDEEITSATSKLETEEDFRSLVSTVCRKRDGPFKCLDDFMAVDAQCSYPSEIESDNSFRTILAKTSDLLCEDDGSNLMSLVFGQGKKCVRENVNKLLTCSYEALYSIVKGFLVKLVENETFEFKMDEQDCKAFDETKTCFASSVENCVDPTATKYFTSVFEIVRNETSCAKNDNIETNLLKRRCDEYLGNISILAKHFWFEVHKNDGLTESLCQICWNQTKTFHEFYKRVEQLQKWFLDAETDKKEIVGSDLEDANIKLDLNKAKCEEQQFTIELIDSPVAKKEDTTVSDYEKLQWSIPENASSDVKFENDDVTDSQNMSAIGRKRLKFPTKEEKEKQAALIREFFSLKCDICSDTVKFKTLLKARAHYRRIHKTIYYVKCCGKKFHRGHQVLKHIRYHTDPYTCHHCGKILKTKESLQCHIDSHTPLDSRAFKCSSCTSSFPSAARLRSHVKLVHTAITGETFHCDICKKSFNSLRGLAYHIRRIHVLSLEYVCDICARAFKSNHALQYHIETEHSTTPPPKVQCDICGIWLKHKSGMKRHIQQHMDSMNLHCSFCDKVVRNKLALRSHVTSAHSGKRYQCSLCDKAFRAANSLKDHFATHTGEYLYNCAYCAKRFKSRPNMFTHRKNAHLAEWTRDKLREVAVNLNT